MKKRKFTLWVVFLASVLVMTQPASDLTAADEAQPSFWAKVKNKLRGKDSDDKSRNVDEAKKEKVEAKGDGFWNKLRNGSKSKASEEEKASAAKEKMSAPSETTVDVDDNPHSPIANEIAIKKSLLDQSIEAKGQVAFLKGLELYNQFKFEEALEQFKEAARHRPDDKETRDYLERVNKVLGKDVQSVQSLSDWEGDSRKVVDQELLISIKHHFEKGKGMVAKADSIWKNGGAKRNHGLHVLNKARLEFTKSFDSLNRLKIAKSDDVNKEEILDAMKGVDALRATWEEELKKDVKIEAEAHAKALEKEQREYRATQIKKLMLQIKSEYLSGRYAKSASLCKVLLSLDPKHKQAKKMLIKSERKRDEALRRQIREKSEEEWRRYNEKIRESAISHSELLVYPEDWDAIKQRKAGSVRAIEEPEWVKRLKQKMDLPVHLVAPQLTLDEAIAQLQDQTRVNFLIDQRLDRDELKVANLNLKDTRLSSALTLVLKSASSDSPLVYEFRDETIFITNKENQARFKRAETVPYDVTDLITTFRDATLQDGVGLSVGTGGGLSGVSDSREAHKISAASIIDIIQTTVEPESWGDAESGVSIVEYETGKLLISHTAKVHKEIHELLNMLRKQQKLQVSIEVRFITSQDDDLFEIGVDWRGLNELQLDDSDIPNQGVGVYSTRTNPEKDTRVATVLGSAGDITTTGAPEFISTNRPGTGLLAEIAVLDPIRAGLAFHALDRKQTLRDILAPRLTVLNNHQGYIVRSQDTSYVSTYAIENRNLIPVVSRISSGELLVVRPTVSSDKKYVTMDLSPQVTRNVNLEQRPLTFIIGGQNGGGNNGGNGFGNSLRVLVASVELPNLQVWQLQTRVQVPDGGVIFVGGRMGNIENDATRGVPVLSKIPLIGRLFRTDSTYSQLNNLIISMQAKILLFDEIEQKLQ